MNPDLEKILSLSYSYANIERDMYYPERPRPENDAEHSFQLALLAWHIIELDKLKLDSLKIFKLCLAHDLVEIYSGDVPLWGNTGHTEKAEREAKSLEKLKDIFSPPLNENPVPDLTDAIAEYKERKTDEAKFVYGLDKLLPFLNQLHIEGKVWKMHSITLNQALAKLKVHAQASEHLTKYFKEAIGYMKENEGKYFSV